MSIVGSRLFIINFLVLGSKQIINIVHDLDLVYFIVNGAYKAQSSHEFDC